MKLLLFLVPMWLLAIIFPPTVRSANMSMLQFVTLAWLPAVCLFVVSGTIA